MAIGALAFDPNLPQIVYVGTGEGNFSGDSYYGLGILKSTDSGTTWVNLAQNTFLRQRFCRLAIVPGSGVGVAASVLFAATTGGPTSLAGLYRSTDAGVTWTRLTSGLPPNAMATDVVLDPINPSTVYV